MCFMSKRTTNALDVSLFWAWQKCLLIASHCKSPLLTTQFQFDRHLGGLCGSFPFIVRLCCERECLKYLPPTHCLTGGRATIKMAFPSFILY